MAGIRVVLADDDVLFREGLASLLDRSGFEIAGQASDATQLLSLVREQSPELVIVDIRMPPGHSTDGLDAAQAIRREFPNTAILVLSAHVEAPASVSNSPNDSHAFGVLWSYSCSTPALRVLKPGLWCARKSRFGPRAPA